MVASNDGFVVIFVIAATPPTPWPGHAPLVGAVVVELDIYETVPLVAVTQ
jgi:hypothetical protein